jgi:Raf kinase inhibitor-like YbhB/YbcL family protein
MDGAHGGSLEDHAHMGRTALGVAIVASVLGCGLAACAGSTASLPVPPTEASSVAGSPAMIPSAVPGSVAASTPTATPDASTTESAMPPFTLHSASIPAGGAIPRRFTCDGEDVSPDLEWDGVPEGTAALVLVVDDPDARGFVHWLVVDAQGSPSGALPLGISTSPDAPRQGTNDFGRVGWGGPCPPSGEHRYVFTLYALAAQLGLPGTPRAGDVRGAVDKATVLGTAILQARYRRGG